MICHSLDFPLRDRSWLNLSRARIFPYGRPVPSGTIQVPGWESGGHPDQEWRMEDGMGVKPDG